MTPKEVAGLAPALTTFLQSFDACFFRRDVLAHFRRYCRGLLSDLPRKSVEPIALEAGCAVRSLQEFLSHLRWDQDRMRDLIQLRVAARHAPAPGSAKPGGDPGVIGLIDECAQPKKGDQTPGVQRQYCGASGKVDNCIVNVHLAFQWGDFKTLIDSQLYLPESWDKDRADGGTRCQDAHIPDDVVYRSKCDIAIEAVKRALGNGLHFDFFTFDEGYGRDPGFLFELEQLGQHYVAEIPVNFRCWPTKPKYHSLRKEFSTKEVRNVVRWSKAFIYQSWQKMTLERKTLAPQIWDVKAAQVYLRDRDTRRPTDRSYWLIVGWNRETDEYKYWLSNSPPATPLPVLLKVAFSRATVEHVLRIAKSEIGMDHFEGRSYLGLMRHLVLCELMMLFLAEQTNLLRGEKTGTLGLDDGAGGPRDERDVRTVAGATPATAQIGGTHVVSHLLSPAEKS